MGQSEFVFSDFLKMGSNLKRGIFCTRCIFLNSLSKNIKTSDHCKKCNRIFKIQYSNKFLEDYGSKNNHVKDFKVVNLSENYVTGEQIILIERNSIAKESNISNSRSRSRDNSRLRDSSTSRDKSRYCDELKLSGKELDMKNDFRDVTLPCEDKHTETPKKVLKRQQLMSEFIYNNILEVLFKEISREIAAEVLEEVTELSKSVCENLFNDEVFEKNTDKFKIKEISNKTCEALCEEVSNEVSSDESIEVVEEMVKNIECDTIQIKSEELINFHKTEFKEETLSTVVKYYSHSEEMNDEIRDDDFVDSKNINKFLQCDVCELSFDNNEQLEEHRHEINVKEEDIEFVYDDFDEFYEHVIQPEIVKLLQKHGIDDTNSSFNEKTDVDFDDSLLLLTCEEPTETFVDDSFLCYQYSIKEEIQNAEENFQNFYYNNKSFQEQDLVPIESKPSCDRYSCEKCNIESNSKENLKIYSESNHESLPKAWSNCEHTLKDMDKLKRLEEAAHSSLVYNCVKCENKFEKIDKIKMYVKTTRQELTNKCIQCNYRKKFKSKIRKSLSFQYKELFKREVKLNENLQKMKQRKIQRRMKDWKKRRKKDQKNNT